MKPGMCIDAQKLGREGDDGVKFASVGEDPRRLVCLPEFKILHEKKTFFRAFILGLVPRNGSSPIKSP